MSEFASVLKPSNLPPLPSKPAYTSVKKFTPETTPEEFEHRKQFILEKYYQESEIWHGNTFLRQISGGPYTMYGVKQHNDWNNMFINHNRLLKNTTSEKIEQNLSEIAGFAIYHFLVTENLDTKMPESKFNSYINVIWNTMEKQNMTPPTQPPPPPPIQSRM